MRCVLLAGLRGSRTVGCGSAAGIEITCSWQRHTGGRRQGRQGALHAFAHQVTTDHATEAWYGLHGRDPLGGSHSNPHRTTRISGHAWRRGGGVTARGACAARQHCRPWRNHRGPVGSPPGRELARYSTLHFGPLLLGKADPSFSHFK